MTKETMKYLGVSKNNVDQNKSEDQIVKAIIGNLQGVAGGIAELRNAYGSGHGKSGSYKGLTTQHAKLAVGSSVTLVDYLWDISEWKRSTGYISGAKTGH